MFSGEETDLFPAARAGAIGATVACHFSISYLFMKAEGGVKRGQGKDNVQLEAPEHPHSPFIVMVLLVGNRTA